MDMNGVFEPAVILGVLGVVFGSLLAFASQKFHVKNDPRQDQIRAALPGANCGGCGFPGCDGFAAAVAKGEAPANGCAAGGSAVAKMVGAIMGVDAKSDEPQVAFVKCKGTPDKTTKNCVYYGSMDCREASVVPGKGSTACAFGCMGLGTCVKVCAFGAMSIKDGIASVDIDKCRGCGTCVRNCPRGVLTLVPKSSKVHVTCNSPLRGPDVKKFCSVGCIGCTLCARTCPKQAISMNGNLAVIDYTKCVNCGLCAVKCPAKNITRIGGIPQPEPAEAAPVQPQA